MPSRPHPRTRKAGPPRNLPLRQSPSTKKDRLTGDQSSPMSSHDQRTIWTFPAQLAARGTLETNAGDCNCLGRVGGARSARHPLFPQYFGLFGIQPWFERNQCGNRHRTRPCLLLCFGIWCARIHTRPTLRCWPANLLVDAGILAWVLKNATGRLRPSAIPPGGSYSDTWFKTYQPPLRADGSFPSEHAIAAFSVATILRPPLSEPPLGTLGGLWGSDFGRLLTRYPAGTFPL